MDVVEETSQSSEEQKVTLFFYENSQIMTKYNIIQKHAEVKSTERSSSVTIITEVILQLIWKLLLINIYQHCMSEK